MAYTPRSIGTHLGIKRSTAAVRCDVVPSTSESAARDRPCDGTWVGEDVVQLILTGAIDGRRRTGRRREIALASVLLQLPAGPADASRLQAATRLGQSVQLPAAWTAPGSCSTPATARVSPSAVRRSSPGARSVAVNQPPALSPQKGWSAVVVTVLPATSRSPGPRWSSPRWRPSRSGWRYGSSSAGPHSFGDGDGGPAHNLCPQTGPAMARVTARGGCEARRQAGSVRLPEADRRGAPTAPRRRPAPARPAPSSR